MKLWYTSLIIWFCFIERFIECQMVSKQSPVDAVYAHVYVDACLPRRIRLNTAFYRISQKLVMSWKCLPGFARPYGLRRNWPCDTNKLSKDIEYRQDYIGSKEYFNSFQCIKETFPKSAYLEGHLDLVSRSHRTLCLKDWDNYLARSAKKWIKGGTETEVINGVRFSLKKRPSKLECYVGYDNSSALSMAKLCVSFRMEFNNLDPKRNYARDGTLEGARRYLKSTLTTLIDELKDNVKDFATNNSKVDDIDPMFHAGECEEENTKIEIDELEFSDRLPVCRKCGKGWFFNKATQRCEGCEQGMYSPTLGRTSCLPCPNLLTAKMRDTTSITDCYEYTPGASGEEFMTAISQGSLFFIVLNFIFAVAMTWSVKKQIKHAFET